ncbi:NAD-dependent epimerase/dehydratase family protein [Cumulibacter soli]|uniref:NAD-dependent epimerase/dehydratase family protein n=1 Tax=Cumulibacter soli TaxID=2546344 RepID=UPI0010682B45|nr:NAD(P)-dependent oxidoreductase [Cumulibacter soli]
MRILITGGTGAIGSLTTRKLIDDGHEVVLYDVAADRRFLGALDDVTLIEGDVLAGSELRAAAEGADVLVHLAYSLGEATNLRPAEASELNVMGTVNAFEAARAAGVPRLVTSSSVAIYGADARYPAADLPLREDAAPLIADGMPLYGAGKLYLEKLADRYREQFGVLGLGLRPSPVYGLGGRRGVSGWLAGIVESAVREGAAVIDKDIHNLSLVYVDDVATQFAALATIPAERIQTRYFFNTGGSLTSMREFARTLELIAPGCTVTVEGPSLPDLAGLPGSVDDAAISALVGPRTFDLESGLRHWVASLPAQ